MKHNYSKLLVAALLLSTTSFAQGTSASNKPVAPKNWHLLDKSSTGFPGISLDKAYSFVKSKNVNKKVAILLWKVAC